MKGLAYCLQIWNNFIYFALGHRENILKTAKALVEDTKTLVAGAASNQEQLAVAASNAVTTIIKLSEDVKAGATSLGSQNQEAQVIISFFDSKSTLWHVLLVFWYFR